MKKFIIILLFIAFSNLLSYSQNSADIKPVYIGMILVDEITSDRMVKVCEEYNLIESETKGDFRVYKTHNGSKICFTVEESSKGQIPVVQIISKDKPSVLKKILYNACFIKDAGTDDYYKGSPFTHRRTKCNISSGSHPTVTFTKVYRSDE